MIGQQGSDFIQKLPVWGAAIVGGHFLVALCHLWLVVRVQPNFPSFAVWLLILFNLLPVAGVVLLAKRYGKWAAILITVPLAVALVIGVSAHFLSAGSDNVLHMPPAA